jgi:hypothetical protein
MVRDKQRRGLLAAECVRHFLCDWIQHAREIAGFQARSRKFKYFPPKSELGTPFAALFAHT